MIPEISSGRGNAGGNFSCQMKLIDSVCTLGKFVPIVKSRSAKAARALAVEAGGNGLLKVDINIQGYVG